MSRSVLLTVLCLAVTFSLAFGQDFGTNIYVAPNGNDTNPGTIEKPLRTLNAARTHVRKIKPALSGNINVWFREGTYQLSETVVFDLEDSGSDGLTITYAAFPGETPVFSSGKEIGGWEKVSTEIPGLPQKAQGNILVASVSNKFLTLYDEVGMLPRAQSAAFFTEPGKNGKDRLTFPPGKLKNWSNLSDVEIKVRPHHAWIMNVLPLKSVDEETNTATTTLEATYTMNKLHFIKYLENCWVENVLEELDEPGEWVLNTKEGKIYLWPRNDSPVVAPMLLELIRVEGKVDKEGPMDIPVRNLHFKGLTFKHGDRYTLTEEDAGLQHDWDILDKNNALVRFRGAENCSIKKCHFLHSGSGAIRVDLHGIKNEISDNHIEYMGGGGVLLCGYGPGTKDVNKENLVFNNHIHHVGEIYWHSPGIFLWQSGENSVSNNLIHHTNYTGIIISGCMSHFFARSGRELTRTIRWHELPSVSKNVSRTEVLPYFHSHDNMIEYNEIHHSMLKMGDGNAIYIRGAGEGNIIRGNYIHDMVGETLMQAAIRTDGGQTGTLITGNLLYKCTSQGILTKLDNKVENNIVADVIAPPRGYYLSVREGPLTGASIQKNIFYCTTDTAEFINELPPGKKGSTEDRRGRALARVMDADTDYNIYFFKKDPKKGEARIAKNQANGVDKHSLAVDPMFVDPDNGDFRFKPESPALKMGIKPFDISKVGLRGTPEAIQGPEIPLADLLDPVVYEVPEVYWAPEKNQGDVKAMFYTTLPYKGKETRAFAFIGIPKSEKPVPAMVLVHGGGGKAFPEWVKMWNDRGYAAIAMSLEGHMPDSKGNGKHRHEYSGPKRVGRFDDMDLPRKEQWMYHAVSDIIIGHTLLASFPEVDPDRIGVTGISWGGILSSLVSGLDSRYKCAIPVYGAGFLYESLGHFGNHGNRPHEFIERKKFWDPSKQLADGSVPTLWVNSDSDGHFSFNITSSSYKFTSNHAYMSIHPSMPHGHKAGWDIKRVPEIYAFADYYLKNNGPEFCKITQQPAGRNSVLAYKSGTAISKATIHYLNEPLTYRPQKGEKHSRPGPWLTKSAKIKSNNNTVIVKLPQEVMTYYINLEDERGFITSSVLVELE